MNCPYLERVTEAYLSGEVDTPEWSTHLKDCVECSAQLRAESDFDLIIRHAVNEERLQTRQLEAHVRAAIRKTSPWRPPMFVMLRYGIAAGVVLATLLIGTISYAKGRMDHTALCTDAAEDHQEEIIAKAPRKWRTDPKLVEALSQQMAGDPAVPQRITPPGYHLVGARICILHDTNYMHLDYSNGSNEISLFVARQPATFTGRVLELFRSDTAATERVEGLTVGSVEKKHISLVLVSASPLSDMRRIVEETANQL
jgi:hypothetical protein